jgi:hypothetical protein
MIACAVLASLAFGVLTAYGLCLAMFRLLQGRSAAVMTPRLEAQPVEAGSKI